MIAPMRAFTGHLKGTLRSQAAYAQAERLTARAAQQRAAGRHYVACGLEAEAKSFSGCGYSLWLGALGYEDHLEVYYFTFES